jgi:hypothetical protein
MWSRLISEGEIVDCTCEVSHIAKCKKSECFRKMMGGGHFAVPQPSLFNKKTDFS